MSVSKIPLLDNLQGDWRSFRVEFAGEETTELTSVYPFTSVSDLKRQLWMHKDGDPRWAPDRVFVCVRAAAGTVRPIEFHWPASVSPMDIPEPTTTKQPNPALVDETGVRKPVGPVMIGALTLETALSPEIMSGGAIPVVTAFSLASLKMDDVPLAVFGGYYQFYFPWLTSPAQIIESAMDSPALRESYAAVFPYIEDRTGRIELVEKALISMAAAGSDSVTMNSMVRLRWTLPPPAAKPLSLERTFYSLTATETIPFMRYFPSAGVAGQSPLLKLALKADGAPILDDEKLYAQYLNQPAPNIKSAVIMARIPMASDRRISFILYMFEDGTCDLTLEVPQRGSTYIAAVAVEAQRVLQSVVSELGFAADTVPMLRDLHATYRWVHPRSTAPLTAARIKARVSALTPFLEAVPVAADSQALAVFQWRAVSNYESESAQFAYITQMVLRGGSSGPSGVDDGPEMLRLYGAELAERFGLTKEVAGSLLERWIERRGEAVAPVAHAAGSLAVPKFSTGASVSITGAHPEYFLEVQGVDSYDELQRLVSVVGVLLGAPSSELTISAPAAAIKEAAAAVAVEDAVVAEVGEEEEEMDPAIAALMADLGFGGGAGLGDEEEGENEEEEKEGEEGEEGVGGPELVVEELEAAAGPAPNLDAAVAAVEGECHGNPWTPGEPALKITSDYYMAKLKKHDKVMFGYAGTVTGRSKGYSKSCQRQDGRQPNLMTLPEYARIQRCYEGRVRFVNLPPTKPSDLPMDPNYNGKRRMPDEYYYTDHSNGPTHGWPLWTVYGYESKTRPGEFLYLICPELWCDRDNLPLLPAEFEGTEGRGFTKPPMTCPFCRGRAIQSIDTPMPGESVIVRKIKGATGKLHRYVGVITRNKHPNGYELPCCDTSPRLLEKYMKAAYFGKSMASVDPDVDEPEPAPELGLEISAPAAPSIIYSSIFTSMQTQYLLKEESSLRPGTIGLLPPLLDKFFGQDSQSVKRKRGTSTVLAPDMTAFVRLGVDTQTREPGLNLYAALAPFMALDSAEACRAHFLQRHMVRAFESANYGTLVHEFAAKSSVSEEELRKSLAEFAGRYGYNLETNRPHIVRLYRAWTAFLKMLADNRTPKKLRHLEHLLAQPRVVTNNGLLLVVLEKKGDEIQVVCPSFGIPAASLFGDVPVAFMFHEVRDESWEPLILYNGTKDATIFFDDPELSKLPEQLRNSIRAWLKDWRSSSTGCGRPRLPPHVWTPDRDTRDLPRLSQLLQKIDTYMPTTLVRDRSNRLAGVLFSVAGLFVPCQDDGNLAEELPRVFEAEMIPSAPMDAYLKFYGALPFKGLKPTTALFKGTTVVAFRVAAGSVVPVAPSPLGSSGLPEQQIDELPWERDALILRSPDVAASDRIVMEESSASVEEQFAEAYQYLRMAFSNWLAHAGSPTAKEFTGILNLRLPLYEKRKRADILLEPFIREWLAVETTEERKPLAILREDCLSLEKDTCDSRSACSWSGGRCLIHVPRREESVDPVRVFTARLSDELLRYSSKRNEIMNQKVQAIRRTRGAVRVGDELFLSTRAKESAEAILERLGFFESAAARLPEEMLRFEGLEDAGPESESEIVLAEPEGDMIELGETEEKGIATAKPMIEVAPKEPKESNTLPESWTEKGMKLNEGLTPQATFAAASGKTLDDWNKLILKWRNTLSLPGDRARPVTWDTQDWHTVSRIIYSDILFVKRGPTGALVVDKWIEFKVPPAVDVSHMYVVFWNGKAVSRGKVYRFFTEGLPIDLTKAMDAASPIPDEEAKADVAPVAPAPVVAAPVVKEAEPAISESSSASTSESSSASTSESSSEPDLELLTPEAKPETKPETKPEAEKSAVDTVTAAVGSMVDSVKKAFTGEEEKKPAAEVDGTEESSEESSTRNST